MRLTWKYMESACKNWITRDRIKFHPPLFQAKSENGEDNDLELLVVYFDSNSDSKKKQRAEVGKGPGKHCLRPNSVQANRY